MESNSDFPFLCKETEIYIKGVLENKEYSHGRTNSNVPSHKIILKEKIYVTLNVILQISSLNLGAEKALSNYAPC